MPNDLIKGKGMYFCSQLEVCSKQLMRKLSAGSASEVCFDTTVVQHDFVDRTPFFIPRLMLRAVTQCFWQIFR